MASYIDRDVLRVRLGEMELRQLSQVGDDFTDHEPNDVRMDAAIEAASSEIDAVLAVSFSVPLPCPPPIDIQDICFSLARERLDTLDRREVVATDAAMARERLRDFADGRRALIANGKRVVPIARAGFTSTGDLRTAVYRDDTYLGDSWDSRNS